jgi:hypothetical protein
VGEDDMCPVGCIVDENGQFSETSHFSLKTLHKKTNKNHYFSSKNNDHFTFSTIEFSNSHFHNINVGTDQLEHVCVLEPCGRFSITDCLKHVEYRCFPTEGICKFITDFIYLFVYFFFY